MCACEALSLFFCLFLFLLVFLSFRDSETLIKINIIGFSLHPTNVFSSLGTLVFPFITWAVWNWKPSFSKIGSTSTPPIFFLSYESVFQSSARSLSLSFPYPLPSHFFTFLCTLLFHFVLTSYNIHYIMPSTHHRHANILPSTGQENNSTSKKRYVILLLNSFFIVFNCLIVV